MKKNNDHQHLAWFLGPKAENANSLEEFIVQVLRDYSHWRKNYFPGDPILINKKLKLQLEQEHDLLDTKLNELLAQLRRNFPFYSPRYIAHELSDTLISSTIGYFSGLLFNPNNVTPEAAPVTAELEIEVCNLILSMLGYTPSPVPPGSNENAKDYYAQKSKEEFGWSHLTSGGTVANIEAIWVARQVRYFPLAVKEIAVKKNIKLTVKLPSVKSSKNAKPIQEIDDYDLLLLKPNESIYLLSRYLDALSDTLRKSKDLPEDGNLSKIGWQYLDESQYSLSKGFASAFVKFPPVILVAGSRHYSVTKAANILGIGQANIVHINTDENFRLDVNHLEDCLQDILKEKKVPLCVVASAGTTEEGAVDPIHEIAALRKRLEEKKNLSFWLHIDAAWGGFMRSVFCLEDVDKVEAVANEISRMIHINPPQISIPSGNENLKVWHRSLTVKILEIAKNSKNKTDSGILNKSNTDEKVSVGKTQNKVFTDRLSIELKKMSEFLTNNEFGKYQQSLIELTHRFVDKITEPKINSYNNDLVNSPNTITNWTSIFASTKMNIGKNFIINFPDIEVVKAFLDFPKADSITVDPHKMGYAPYPAGCIAFKNDRVRSFILQHAPYITSVERNELLHLPPRHTDLDGKLNDKSPIVVESFSPFMLEGSKPGAVAAGLWLAYQTVPLVPKRHGLIVRASVLAARSLYEWLARWKDWCELNLKDLGYEFFVLTPRQPDTNIINFTVKPRISDKLNKMNSLTSKVYETFTIQAELGKREYSYAQPFFLSNTKMNAKDYPSTSLKNFFKRCGLNRRSEIDYEEESLVVLRATVMNPYILASQELADQNFIQLFVEELDKAAAASLHAL